MGLALLRGRTDGSYVPVWELQDAQRFLAWVGALARAGFYDFVSYIPVGFFAALATLGRPRRSPVGLVALVVTGGIAASILVVENGHSWRLAATAGLVLPLLGGLMGTWMGTSWLRGRRARLLLLPKVALMVLLVALGAGVVLSLSVEAEPLPFKAAEVTSARKRELVRLIRSKSPRSLEEGQTHTLRLTEDDVNVLLAWGFSIGATERKAKVQFAPEAAALDVSVGVTRGGKKRHLNLRLAGEVKINDGTLRLRVDRCRLGRVDVPSWLLNPWCPVVASLLSHDRRSRPFLDAIEAMSIGPGWIEATYTGVNLPPGFREDLFGPGGAGEEVLVSTRVYVRHLLTVIGRLPPQEPPTFGMCFETVFVLARERSVEGDPVVENRAAVFALGVLMGHWRIQDFLGWVMPANARWSTRQSLRRVRLRDRNDWTRHFCVSAAIALFSDTAVSDAAGLLKEELDADTGGSGFSFADLLADRAGTTFAMRATRDEAAARDIQNRIGEGFRVDDFFPPAADLPEGIPDAELQSRYGGVGGEAYLRLMEEIERRLASCAAYR